MPTVTFNSYIPKGSYDHYANGPINWSGITKMETLDRTYADSSSMDDRDLYEIRLFQPDMGWIVIPFGFDHELRDKCFDVIKNHQETNLKSY
jgi:hypothetical protein